jgi:probable rRNA maturation factor
MSTSSIQEWRELALIRLKRILKVSQGMSGLVRLGPTLSWKVEVQLVNRPVMSRLNQSYRGKEYPTDILSFPVLKPFWNQGLLGELVICLPTLKAQAKSLGHSPELELEVLLTHGVLHLLGLDHERGKKQAELMSEWERRILAKSLPSSKSKQLLGLIDRSGSGNKPL